MMGKAVRSVALVVAVCLGAALFMIALAVALGMLVLGIVALFSAYAVAPEDTKSLISRSGAMLDRSFRTMADVVRESGELVREIVKGRTRGSASDDQTMGSDGKVPGQPTDGTQENSR